MDDEVFTLLGWAWDVALASRLARRHPIRPAAIRTLTGVMGLIRVDPDHAATVDIAKPLLIVPLPYAPPPGNRLVIDGWHRIHRALDLGLEELPAIFLDLTDERACRLRGGDV
ncbi:ParB N-terminal domain-containing protein [Spongiactinospora rosea]|uniref:hypothetical protein n=1 Tax=Spongiactinospora rosea TaxID=2248750 RepID=UPI0011C0319E|nr:hypothetical protein [Spongiactinospora rosea]